jgi:hypothetical protein
MALPTGTERAFAPSDKFFENKTLPVNPEESGFCGPRSPAESAKSLGLNTLVKFGQEDLHQRMN